MSENVIDNSRLLDAIEVMKTDSSTDNVAEFISALCQARILLPIKVDESEVTVNEDGSHVLNDASNIHLLSVVNEQDEDYLLTFTDWDVLKNWDGNHKGAIIRTYQELSDIIFDSSTSFKGFALNPFTTNFVMNEEKLKVVNEALEDIT